MQPSILQADPKANYLAHKAEIDEAISRVLESGRYILGRETEAFEKEFAAYLGAAYAVGVGNGTDALEIALRTCGVGPGDGVVTVSHTAVATVAAIERTGAFPVFVDIDPASFTMDPGNLNDTLTKIFDNRQPGITPTPKAVIPVHLYGYPADMPAILEICQRYELYVVEDCAQAHGAALQGRKTGTWGNIGTFSFYPTKNLSAIGDGGAVVTSNPNLYDRARMLREYGWRTRYISELPGMNSRLDEIQAAILRVKLRYLEEENSRRREIAQQYNSFLAGTPMTLPKEQPARIHIYHQYVVRSRQRDKLKEYLKSNSIGSLIHYPIPIHLQPAYKSRLKIENGGLPYTEQVCREILSLPIYPQMKEEEILHVINTILNFFS